MAAVTFAGGNRPFSPQFGDTISIYEGAQSFTPATLKPNGEFQNRFGVFKHADLAGKPYGSKARQGIQ